MISFSFLGYTIFPVPMDYELVTVGAAAVGFNEAKVEASTVIRIRIEGDSIRVHFHGVDPTDTVGLPYYAGESELLSNGEAKKFRMIRDVNAGGDAKVHAVYYR